jgi:hypothetical protein
MQRIFVVYNKRSSNYVRVKEEFLAKLPNLQSCTIGKYDVSQSSDFDKNVTMLSKCLENGDIAIAAGGDATASITVNAILKSGKDVTLAVLPYGNFNDLARTLGMLSADEIIGRVAGMSRRRASGAWQGEDERAVPVATGDGDAARGESIPDRTRHAIFYPLAVTIDGTHWRYAACYVTIGMTAEAVAIFDDPKIRKEMQKGHKSSWRSYLQLAKWYFKNRHKKVFIPDFKINGEPQPHKTSDYAAVNGKSMSRVMKGGNDYLKPDVFRSETEKTISFPKLFILMARSILRRTPGHDTTGDTLTFDKPATITLQCEGEYRTFTGVKTIEIRKDSKKCLKVIQS